MRKLLTVILIVAVLVLGVVTVFRCGGKVSTQVMATSNMAKADKLITEVR